MCRLPIWKPEVRASQDELQELARGILLRLWEICKHRSDGPEWKMSPTALVSPMAQLDPAVALDWSRELGGELDVRVRLEGADVLAAVDSSAAIQVIKKTPEPSMALEKFLQLAIRFAETDPPRAIAFTQEAATQARAMDECGDPGKGPRRALLFRLGRTDEGKHLIEEAVTALPQPGPATPKQPVRLPRHPGLLQTVRALALFDLKRAQALAEPLQQSYSPERVNGILAPSVAMTDPSQAVELVKGLGRRQRDSYNTLIEVAYRCGAQRPDEALKIIDGLKGDEGAELQGRSSGLAGRCRRQAKPGASERPD